MGLLDQVLNSPSDQALFALGSGLLGVRRGDEGKAFQMAMGAYNQAKERDDVKKQRELQQKLIEMQLKGQQQKMVDDDAIRKAFSDPSAFTRPAQPAVPWGSGMTGGLDSQDINPGKPAQPSQFDPALLQQALFRTGNPAAIKQAIDMMTKDDAPVALGDGGMLVTKSGKVLVENPKAPKDDPLGAAMAAQAKFPPGSPAWKAYQQYIDKLSTHAPPASITNYGSPVPVELPGGGVGYAQPPNRAGAPTQLVKDPATGKPLTKPQEAKPLPPAIVKSQQELLDQITSSVGINQSLETVLNQIKTGQLILNPAANAIGSLRNWAGYSDPNSRNLASFKANLEKMRNDSLRLNTGVQTEGDAQRAWNEIFSNINDSELVQKRLSEIKVLNQRAAMAKRAQIELLREQYGAEQLTDEQFNKLTGQQPSQGPVGGGPIPGTIENGYRYKGGDPAKRENWERV